MEKYITVDFDSRITLLSIEFELFQKTTVLGILDRAEQKNLSSFSPERGE